MRRLLALIVPVLALTLAAPGAMPAAAAGAEGLRMESAVMLQGHGRVGTWMAIQVRLRNDGPSLVGELRLSVAAGSSGTRFGTPVDLPRQSDKTYVLYAQPPAFGGTLDVTLVSNDQSVATAEVAFTVHETSQLVVGVVAEQPERIVPRLDLAPSPNGVRAAIVSLGPEDLPERVEAWGAIDRLIWQDVDSSRLTIAQLDAMRGWIAAGGRLIVAAGTTGGSVLSSFPDDLLPYRPAATIDVAPDSLRDLLGEIPTTATDVPALAGSLVRGRALASVEDQAIAAEAVYGGGSVAIIGFDATAGWIAGQDATETLWRRLLPPRVGGPVIAGNDNSLVNAVSQLPALALPPIGGLLALLAGYILLIGPINYLVLRRLDRREWAWITMPVLIVVFAAGAYGFGAALRGLDVIVNEVAIVRGAPGATEGTAQVYLGVFSPSRGTYQVEVPGGALLSSTLAGEFGAGGTGLLDVLQGDPSRVRDLVVGFGSLRTLRAETSATVPLIDASLRLEDGVLKGTVTNRSETLVEKPAIVLGGSVTVLGDLAPGATRPVSMVVRSNPFGQSLSDSILGTVILGDPRGTSDATRKSVVRHAVIDQLTFDAATGMNVNLPSESPVLLAWGSAEILDIRISGQQPRRTGNVLYYMPLPMTVRGPARFEGDLLRSTVVETDANFFNKDPFSINMARGTATLAYRPIAFDGSFRPTRIVVGIGGEVGVGEPRTVLQPLDPQPCRDEDTDPPDCADAEPEPLPSCDPNVEGCFDAGFNLVPMIELFDRSDGGRWIRFASPAESGAYEVADPERYVDPASGTLLVRFVNEFQDGIGFNFQVRLEGVVR